MHKLAQFVNRIYFFCELYITLDAGPDPRNVQRTRIGRSDNQRNWILSLQYYNLNRIIRHSFKSFS